MVREWEIGIVRKSDGAHRTFTFVADSKALAHSHAMCLKEDPSFDDVLVSDDINEPCRLVAVRFIGWTLEV